MKNENNLLMKVWRLFERFCHAVFALLFKIIRKDMSDEDFDKIMQFVKFGLVGVTNTIVNYVIYVLSLLLFRAFHAFGDYDIYAAQTVAFILSVLWSYIWNNKFVFKEGEQKRNVFLVLLKTYASYSITGIFLNMLLLYLFVDVMGISEFVAPILNLLITVPVNFILNKFWAYKSPKEKTQETSNAAINSTEEGEELQS